MGIVVIVLLGARFAESRAGRLYYAGTEPHDMDQFIVLGGSICDSKGSRCRKQYGTI